MSLLDHYEYSLPLELIAKEPASPRDSARLLVYDTATDTVTFTSFQELSSVLPQQSVLVFNDTKVVPARLQVKSNVGEPLELLLLLDEGISTQSTVRGLVSRFVSVGEQLRVGGAVFTVRDNRNKWMELTTTLSFQQLSELLNRYGTTPIPPYIPDSPLDEQKLRVEYQSVFAHKEASVAAPTASLHFTPTLIDTLKIAGHTVEFVTLHVGLGTFAPVLPEHITEQRLHKERYEVPEATAQRLLAAKNNKQPIVAIGTTVVRTLESAKGEILCGVRAQGATELFISPPYQYTFPDILITNFHVPRSSLMCMVDAFLQHKGAQKNLLDLYTLAITEKFRFYSFGDGMLIR